MPTPTALRPPRGGVHSVNVSVADVAIAIHCGDADVASAVASDYEALVERSSSRESLAFHVRAIDGGFEVRGADGVMSQAGRLSDALFLLEKAITVEVQRRQAHLLFVHAAVLEWKGGAYLFAAESGSGKSTTTWGLLHHGFGYLSDELAPIDLDTMSVWPYPHALGLKRVPPEYALPPEVDVVEDTIHVPAGLLPGAPIRQQCPVKGVFFPRYSADHAGPTVRRIGPGASAARLYPCVLNALAHPERGLDAVVRLASAVPSFVVEAAGLRETCGLIKATVESETRAPSGMSG